MGNPRPNPYGNHCGTKHKVGKETGGANRGQGRISNEDKARRDAEYKKKQEEDAVEQRRAEEKERQNAAKKHREIQKEYEDYCTVAAKIYESGGLDSNEEEEEDDLYSSNDEDENNENEEEFNELPTTTVHEKTSKKRFCYMPQKKGDSCMWELMNEHQVNMQSMFCRNSNKLWYRGSDDPVAKNSNSVKAWYKTQFSVFNWLVFDAFNIDIKKIKCIHGCLGTGMKKHSYCWSPMICIDHKVWVYHQRLICNCCKKSFTTINPKFMSQLPTRVAERFPFFTSSRGAGIHEALVLQFISLVGTGVIFGSYVKSINELQQIKYAQDQINYYDSVAEALENLGLVFAPEVRTFCMFHYPQNKKDLSTH